MNDVYMKADNIRNLILLFKPFKNQYIVSIPNNQTYTFIADNIQEGIDYIVSKRNEIIITQEINVQKILSAKTENEVVIFLN